MASSPEADELTRMLIELHRELRAILLSVARQTGLTVQQGEMLCALQDRHPSFGELADALGCDKTNITGLADRLAQRGLVERQVDPLDRRVTRLHLTDDGRAFGQRLRDAVATAVDERWGVLPVAQRSALTELLTVTARGQRSG